MPRIGVNASTGFVWPQPVQVRTSSAEFTWPRLNARLARLVSCNQHTEARVCRHRTVEPPRRIQEDWHGTRNRIGLTQRMEALERENRRIRASAVTTTVVMLSVAILGLRSLRVDAQRAPGPLTAEGGIYITKNGSVRAQLRRRHGPRSTDFVRYTEQHWRTRQPSAIGRRPA